MENVYSRFEDKVREKLKVLKTYMVKDESQNLKYVLYKLQKQLNDGSVVEFYKATSFFKLERVSQMARENKLFMEIHTDIVRALYRANVNFCEIIANVLTPTPYGLIFLYGVQSVGNSEEEAIRRCQSDFQTLLSSFQGTHRTVHIGPVNNEIMNFVFKNLRRQKYVSVIKGIPSSKQGSGDVRNPYKTEQSVDEQLEQFLAGSDQIEFCLVLMATPMSMKYINHWLYISLEEQTKWEKQKQGSTSLGMSVGIPLSISMGDSTGTSKSTGTSSGSSENVSNSHSEGTSSGESYNKSFNEGNSIGESKGTSWSDGGSTGSSVSTNNSATAGTGTSAQIGAYGTSLGHNTNNSNTVGSGTSTNVGSSWSDGGSSGTSSTKSTSEGESFGSNKGTSTNDGLSWGSGSNRGMSNSLGSTTSRTSSASTGMNLGFNISKSYQWIDKDVEYICELLGEQNRRLKSMGNGDGGFFVDMYISTDTVEHQKALEGAAQVTWVNANAMIDPLRLETPSIEDQKKLGTHLLALSPCMDVVYNPNNSGGYYYKFSSVLASKELAGYCHPPRISIGGLDSATEDIPQVFSVPTNRQNNEIMIGHVLAPSRYSYEMSLKTGNGYATSFKYSIGNNEMHHAFISGASRSGKSVLATRAVLEMYNNAITTDKYGVKKRKRVLVLDPKGEWRAVASLIPKGKFKFYSVGKTNFHPLSMNLLRVPVNVSPYNYFNIVVSHFCSAYGLLDRAIAQIGTIIYDLYEKNDVFGHDDDPKWANEHSKDITLEDVCTKIDEALKNALATRNNHDAEALQTYLTRLDMYRRKHSCEYKMFCNRGGDSADTLLGADDFTVIESNGLSDKSMRFFFILLMNSIYENALNNGPGGFYNGSYETVIVLEEANSVLISSGSEDTSGQQSIQRFNEIIDKSASLGLFIWTITQKIASMPKSVIANSGIVFVGRTAQGDDVQVINAALGFDERKNLEIKKFYPRMSVGMFIAKVSKGKDIQSQTPVLIQASMLHTTVPSDQELDIILEEHEVANVI